MTSQKNKPFCASIITLFPEAFPATLSVSLIGAALEKEIWQLNVIDLKAFAPKPPSHHIDGSPAGGGAGMVMRPDVAARAIDEARAQNPAARLIYLTPTGKPFTQAKAQELSQAEGVILLCARYEGIDQRAIEARQAEEISIGDFVLAGGEVAALSLLEAVVRLLPSVLGDQNSLNEESFADPNLLEYPHYTAPREWEGKTIPDVLLSGDHKKIASWRKEQAQRRTQKRRPDLAGAGAGAGGTAPLKNKN